MTVYKKRIVPGLANISVSTIASALGISEPYATNLRQGRRVPHLRHWQKLAQLAGVAQPL